MFQDLLISGLKRVLDNPIKNCFFKIFWPWKIQKLTYLQLALFALISSIAATSTGGGSGNVLLVVDNFPTRFGLWPFRRGQIGQVGHIPNRRRWVAGRRRCGQGHCGRQYSLPRWWSWCWTRDQGVAGSAAYPGHSCHCCYLQWEIELGIGCVISITFVPWTYRGRGGWWGCCSCRGRGNIVQAQVDHVLKNKFWINFG